jgi:coenzyme PQQ precursor peptide PqqA
MVAPMVCGTHRGDHAVQAACSGPAQVNRLACHFTSGGLSMQWTTPTACDLRFGFEITMYVSAR